MDENGPDGQHGHSELLERIVADESWWADGDVEALPGRLAQAAAEVLGADGAGLSVLSAGIRVPLGASSSQASTMERLQFTVEEGPCWDAVRAQQP